MMAASMEREGTPGHRVPMFFAESGAMRSRHPSGTARTR